MFFPVNRNEKKVVKEPVLTAVIGRPFPRLLAGVRRVRVARLYSRHLRESLPRLQGGSAGFHLPLARVHLHVRLNNNNSGLSYIERKWTRKSSMDALGKVKFGGSYFCTKHFKVGSLK